MKVVKVKYCDYWKEFNAENDFIFKCLDKFYGAEISEDPDFILYSCWGKSFKEFDGIRVFFTGENIRANFGDCDYALSFDYCERDNHLRLPLYVFYTYTKLHQLIKGEEDFEGILREKTKFCNFIYSNARCKIRNKFFKTLSQYKKVDAAGKLFNNIGGTIDSVPGISRTKAKMEFIRPYKFTIAFENSSYPGYTTEKLVQPMMARSIPIYWGNEIVDREFNNKSFLSLHEFANMDALIEEIIKIDQDDELYLKYLKEPYFYNNQPNEYFDLERIKLFFNKILKIRQKT